jgi:hypothetical protein
MLALIVAATLAAAPATSSHQIAPRDLVGMWTTLRGRCGAGQHRLTASGDYTAWCYDTFVQGRWSLRDSTDIVVHYSAGKPREEIIVITGFERQPDRTFISVRYRDGSSEKWMK